MLLQLWAALRVTRNCARPRPAKTSALLSPASLAIADAVTPTAESQADWIDVVAWDRQAEFVCKYFQKGSLIVVDGRLQSRSYQDKTGANRTAVEVVANNINFAGPKSSNPAPMGDNGEPPHPRQPPPARQRSRHRRPAIPLAATMTLP